MRSIMNIKLRFYFSIRRLFLNVKNKLAPSVEKQKRAKQSTIGGG